MLSKDQHLTSARNGRVGIDRKRSGGVSCGAWLCGHRSVAYAVSGATGDEHGALRCKTFVPERKRLVSLALAGESVAEDREYSLLRLALLWRPAVLVLDAGSGRNQG